MKANIGRINSVFGGDSVESIFENLKKDNSDWSRTQFDILCRMSPTSLKVTFEQIKRGGQLSLSDCLRMEFRMSQNFVANSDFYEGVRAALIDKDKKPQWQPPTIALVTSDVVDDYFKPLGDDFKELQL